MRFANTTKFWQCYAVVVLMKYPKTSFVVALLGVIWLSTLRLCRVESVLGSHHAQIIQPIFHSESPVTDISNGSLEFLFDIFGKSSFNFVMYYVRWSGQSKKVVYEFHRASKKFKGEVSFIAINCWVGTCRQTSNFNSYPQLFFHHTTYTAIEYKGRHKATHLVKFVHDALYPFMYISNNIVLNDFLDQGKPSLLAFFNGTNYHNEKYNRFFGAALLSFDKVAGLQFGVITCFQVAALVDLKRFGQVVLVNALKSPQVYPSSLNFTENDLLHWAEQNKIEYITELAPDMADPKEFGVLLKSSPSLILFVPKNAKDSSKALLRLYHRVAISYQNCSCDTSNRRQNLTDALPAKTTGEGSREKAHDNACGKLLKNAHVTSCQSLPLSFGNRHGMQNVCDVCRECHDMCSCDVDSFPLAESTATFSILRNQSPLRNSCRSLRKNYRESNALSFCCFQKTIPRFREMVLSESVDSLRGQIQTELREAKDFKGLADELKILDGDINDAVSRNDPGILKRVLENLLKMFSSNVPKDDEERLGDSDGDTAGLEDSKKSEHREFGTCDRPGKIRVFDGASCYSNITINFYYMDSRKYWSYAEALGVRYNFKSRIALVMVDVKNEAQYVLPEREELTNASIVDFVMNFIRGNLTRRLRSAPVPTQPCLSSGCIMEVVSLTFNQLVLDPVKDVLLMYYASWCGFCKSVKPVYLALANHYKASTHVRIARINADLNDLPWGYTVDSYPSFVFFPAKRKDLSVAFPDYEERILENFIRFVENHKSVFTSPNHGCATNMSRAKILSLEQEKSVLREQNNLLQWRLRRQLETRLEADKKRLAAERKVAALTKENSEHRRVQFDLEDKIRELTLENANLLEDIFNTKEQVKLLQEHGEMSIKTVEELRTKNAELRQILSNLQDKSPVEISEKLLDKTKNKE